MADTTATDPSKKIDYVAHKENISALQERVYAIYPPYTQRMPDFDYNPNTMLPALLERVFKKLNPSHQEPVNLDPKGQFEKTGQFDPDFMGYANIFMAIVGSLEISEDGKKVFLNLPQEEKREISDLPRNVQRALGTTRFREQIADLKALHQGLIRVSEVETQIAASTDPVIRMKNLARVLGAQTGNYYPVSMDSNPSDPGLGYILMGGVKNLQTLLNSPEVRVRTGLAHLEITGVMDVQTEAALKKAQKVGLNFEQNNSFLIDYRSLPADAVEKAMIAVDQEAFRYMNIFAEGQRIEQTVDHVFDEENDSGLKELKISGLKGIWSATARENAGILSGYLGGDEIDSKAVEEAFDEANPGWDSFPSLGSIFQYVVNDTPMSVSDEKIQYAARYEGQFEHILRMRPAAVEQQARLDLLAALGFEGRTNFYDEPVIAKLRTQSDVVGQYKEKLSEADQAELDILTNKNFTPTQLVAAHDMRRAALQMGAGDIALNVRSDDLDAGLALSTQTQKAEIIVAGLARTNLAFSTYLNSKGVDPELVSVRTMEFLPNGQPIGPNLTSGHINDPFTRKVFEAVIAEDSPIKNELPPPVFNFINYALKMDETQIDALQATVPEGLRTALNNIKGNNFAKDGFSLENEAVQKAINEAANYAPMAKVIGANATAFYNILAGEPYKEGVRISADQKAFGMAFIQAVGHTVPEKDGKFDDAAFFSAYKKAAAALKPEHKDAISSFLKKAQQVVTSPGAKVPAFMKPGSDFAKTQVAIGEVQRVLAGLGFSQRQAMGLAPADIDIRQELVEQKRANDEQLKSTFETGLPNQVSAFQSAFDLSDTKQFDESTQEAWKTYMGKALVADQENTQDPYREVSTIIPGTPVPVSIRIDRKTGDVLGPGDKPVGNIYDLKNLTTHPQFTSKDDQVVRLATMALAKEAYDEAHRAYDKFVEDFDGAENTRQQDHENLDNYVRALLVGPVDKKDLDPKDKKAKAGFGFTNEEATDFMLAIKSASEKDKAERSSALEKDKRYQAVRSKLEKYPDRQGDLNLLIVQLSGTSLPNAAYDGKTVKDFHEPFEQAQAAYMLSAFLAGVGPQLHKLPNHDTLPTYADADYDNRLFSPLIYNYFNHPPTNGDPVLVPLEALAQDRKFLASGYVRVQGSEDTYIPTINGKTVEEILGADSYAAAQERGGLNRVDIAKIGLQRFEERAANWINPGTGVREPIKGHDIAQAMVDGRLVLYREDLDFLMKGFGEPGPGHPDYDAFVDNFTKNNGSAPENYNIDRFHESWQSKQFIKEYGQVSEDLAFSAFTHYRCYHDDLPAGLMGKLEDAGFSHNGFDFKLNNARNALNPQEYALLLDKLGEIQEKRSFPEIATRLGYHPIFGKDGNQTYDYMWSGAVKNEIMNNTSHPVEANAVPGGEKDAKPTSPVKNALLAP